MPCAVVNIKSFCTTNTVSGIRAFTLYLTLLHSEPLKLHRVLGVLLHSERLKLHRFLAVLSEIGLRILENS